MADSSRPIRPRDLSRAWSPLWFASLQAPEVSERLQGLGLDQFGSYFAARAAPLGRASKELVLATFFNFSPAAVGAFIPGAWDIAAPDDILAAQQDGVHAAFARALADVDPAVVEEAAGLLRRAAEAASAHPEGRPLFAAYSALPWPDDPMVALWHAQYLLREFRGDGHIAALTAAGLHGIEAMLLHLAQVPALEGLFRFSRAWSDDELAVARERLRAGGWLTDDDPPVLTAEGERRREELEARTDALDAPAWDAVGDEGRARLLELAPVVTDALAAAGIGGGLPSPPK